MGGVAWTKEEDHLLKTCIEQYGEGKWHRIPVLAGLKRCRKSCRLRWLNYLRPNIKRGTFAEDEVELIIKLQKLIGNRWSFIAGKLPGRTANDVKNYWKCHLSKKINTQDQAADKESPSSFRPQPYNLVPNSKWPTTLQEDPNIIAPSDEPRDTNPSIKDDSLMTTLASSSTKKLANEDAEEEGHLVPKGDYHQVNDDYMVIGENDLVGDFSLDFGLEDLKVASKWDSDDLIFGMDLWSESL